MGSSYDQFQFEPLMVIKSPDQLNPLSVCTWLLKFFSFKFKVWSTGFFPTLNWTFNACVACKNPVQTRKKIQFIKLEISNWSTGCFIVIWIFFKWLWGVERLRILMIYLWLHGLEGYPFVFHHPVFKKVASAGLNSLWQKRC